ncbi:MAG TPA: tail fiber protein [Caulobacteraceae bacterium]|nr:tail fiber protein [Caulobacteraceae bacterium]
MYAIDNPTAAGTMPTRAPAGTAGFFTEGNPTTGTPATIVPADFLNALMNELLNVLGAAAITPSKTNDAQLLAAIRALITASTGGVASFNGRAGAVSLTQADVNAAIGGNDLVNSMLANMAASTVKANLTGGAAAPQDVTLAALQAALGITPSGSITPFAGTIAPAGWLFCNGSAVSRTTYAALFGVCSTTYGAGDGSTTFNVPDLRGVFVRGLDSGRGFDAGRALGNLQQGQVQAHKHISSIGDGGYPYGGGGSGAVGLAGSDTDQGRDYTNDGTNDVSYGNPNAAGVVGTETRPINVALNYIIKT